MTLRTGTGGSIRNWSWGAGLLGTFLAACGGGDGPSGTTTPPPRPVAEVSVTGGGTIIVGSTLQLQAVARDGAGAVLTGRQFAWSSGDMSRATVSATGLVTGTGVGSVTITATTEGKSGTAVIQVLDAVASVTVAPSSIVLTAGSTETLAAILRDASGAVLSNRTLAWTTSDGGVATVSGTGIVTGLGIGTAIITASVEGRSAQASVSVTFAAATTDFGTTLQTKSMSGLLHGLNLTGAPNPPASTYTLLKPRLWRMSYTPDVGVLNATNASMEYLLAGLWGFAADRWPRGKPWENTSGYEAMLRQAAQTIPRTPNMVWEVWNEPDPFFNRDFWDGTEQQFFETYKRSYQILRSELGTSALIAGPSIGTFDLQYLKRFADYCLANGCEVNVLTWHELGYYRPLSTIAEHLQAVRSAIVDNPAYAALKVSRIDINESVGPLETYNPAASLLYLQYLELGGADYAARACWPDSNNVTNCYNNSLDGLISPTTSKPRGVWWAYKSYADGADARVTSTTSSVHMLSLASRSVPSTSTAQVLVGYSNVADPTVPGSFSLGVRFLGLNALPFLAGKTEVHVDVTEIQHTGEQEMLAPIPVLSMDLVISKGRAVLTIPAAHLNSVYVVALSAKS